jgi:hypothetical protein
MRVRFGELSTGELREKERLCAGAREAWRCLRDGDDARATELIELADPRLLLSVRRHAHERVAHVELTALEACAWPLAELLLAQAPADLDCALSLGRGAVPLENALAEVRASHGLDLERASVRAGFGRGHLLDVTLGVPGGTNDENTQNAAENLVRVLLGDRLFETWIGAVHVTPAPRGGPLRVLDVRAPRATLQLNELFDTVAAAARGVLQGLARSPGDGRAEAGVESSDPSDVDADADCNAAREDWTLLEVEPLAGARGQRKDDLVLASTCTPELLRCYLDGSPCASRRFSRSGERFVFVSYRDDERTMQARVARRAVIERVLSESVTRLGIGRVTGVGFGVRTTYVDLALSDLELGLMHLVSTLKDADAPVHSSIQFFDSEFADEWVSIWPDSRLPEG